MILHKETYKKFGYYPNSLPKTSSLKVIIKCPFCKNNRESTRTLTSINIPGTCRPCSLKICINKLKLKRKQIVKNSTAIDITPKIWVDLFESGFIKRNGTIVFKQKPLTSLESCRIFKGLKLITSKNTVEFKNNLIQFLLKQNAEYKFYCKNLIVSKYTFKIFENSIRTNIKSNRYKIFFNTYYDVEYKQKNYLNITKGSFYINNEWVHIG